MTNKSKPAANAMTDDEFDSRFPHEKAAIDWFIRKSGLIPRSSAPAQIRHDLQRLGIKPDGIMNFLSNEPPIKQGAV
jgi:hypothetical protein